MVLGPRRRESVLTHSLIVARDPGRNQRGSGALSGIGRRSSRVDMTRAKSARPREFFPHWKP